MYLVLTTTPTLAEAETLAEKIIEAKLAACAQILPQIKSFYWWENQIQKESESLILIKTLAVKFDELKEFIQTNHSYEIPEIVGLEAGNVAENYLDWIKNSL